MNDEHPTVEQGLHSIALSLIDIRKELRDTRRIHKDTLRFLKSEAQQPVFRPIPRRRTIWSRLRRFIPV